jgi:AraC-like DNA-binding protein
VASALSDPKTKPMPAGGRRLRVLVVEDDARVRTLLADMLESVAEVHTVSSVAEAGQVIVGAPAGHFDLVVIDCLFTSADGTVWPLGIELMGTISTRHPALPILAITGADDSEALIVAAFENGARDLLRKPFGVDDFRASVERLTLRRPRHRAPPRTQEGVARVLTFLAEHVSQPFSLDELARIAVMSRFHLSRSFRSTVGMPLRVYVRNLRLERAQQMLARSPERTLTQVALDAGFYDLPHFDKAFRERYGMTPREFRKSTQGAPPA